MNPKELFYGLALPALLVLCLAHPGNAYAQRVAVPPEISFSHDTDEYPPNTEYFGDNFDLAVERGVYYACRQWGPTCKFGGWIEPFDAKTAAVSNPYFYVTYGDNGFEFGGFGAHVVCPYAYSYDFNYAGRTTTPTYLCIPPSATDLTIPHKNLGKGTKCDTRIGNPLCVVSQNKFQEEIDFIGNGPNPLTFFRYYNSQLSYQSQQMRNSNQIGASWRHSFQRSLKYRAPSQYYVKSSVWLDRPDGKRIAFVDNNGVWITDSDIHEKIVYLTDGAGNHVGWEYHLSNNDVEEYDAEGKLTAIRGPDGSRQSLQYIGGKLTQVTSEIGESVGLSYDGNGNVIAIEDLSGRTWKYQYDVTGNLQYVLQPDATPLDDTDNFRKQYHYENTSFPHALTGITDERGVRYATYAYDTSGLAISTSHAGNAQRIDIANVQHDNYSQARTYTVRDSRGTNWLYTSTSVVGTDVSTRVAAGGTTLRSYSYDPVTGNLLTKTINGITTQFGNYDGNGQLGFEIEAAGTTAERRTDYTYDTRFIDKPSTIAEPSVYAGRRKTTSYTYDSFGNTTSVSINGYDANGGAIGQTTTFQYNGPSNQLSQIDGPRTDVQDITVLRYYANNTVEGFNRGRLKEIQDPSGTLARSNIQYTATGQISSELRPNGLAMTYSYYTGSDWLESVTETTASASRTTHWTYVPTGEVETVTVAYGTPDASTVTFFYDDARRLVRTSAADGSYIEYTLDSEGNREKENIYDSAGILQKALTQTFDIFNKLQSRRVGADPLDALEQTDYAFSPLGTLSNSTNGMGKLTSFTYDALNRIATMTQDQGGLGAVSQYSYDVAGNQNQVTDPHGGKTTSKYDDLGNVIEIASPDTGTTTLTHDQAGNVLSKKDAKGQTTLYAYDVLNRVVTADAPGTSDDITYGYDNCAGGIRRICNVTTGGIAETYAYNGFGNVISHQQINYDYDIAGRVKTITYPSGAIVRYGYNNANQAIRVDLERSSGVVTLAQDMSYVPFGPVKSMLLGNGVRVNQDVDTGYRLISQYAAGVVNLGYNSYDKNGNLTSRSDAYAPTSNFSYDALNRLDLAAGPFGTRDYGYDLNGNRLTLNSNGATTSYGYQLNSNRPVSKDALSYTVDANGNITGLLAADGTGKVNAFTSLNRLQSVSNRSAATTKGKAKFNDVQMGSYNYNGLGQRSNKNVGSVVTQFRYGTDGLLLAELDGSNNVRKEYIYLNGRPLAVLDSIIESSQTAGTETILDDGDLGASSLGTWSSQTDRKGLDYNGDYLVAGGGTGSTYRWTPRLPNSGTYDVYAWWVANRKNAANVPYSIDHNGTLQTVTVNQTTNGGAWVLLGTFDFNKSGNEYVEVSDKAGATVADAVRFVGHGIVTTVVTTSLYYIHNDHLGAPVAMTNGNGAPVWRAAYDPFGFAITAEDVDGDGKNVVMNVRFPGQYFDAESGLHYNYYRYYDPSTGRYITGDPIGLNGGLNTYAYTDGNPVNFADPLGLCPICIPAVPAIIEGIGTAIGLGVAVGIGASTPVSPQGADAMYHSDNRPPPGSKGIDETPWSGDHQGIKAGVGAGPRDKVKIDPDDNVWVQNPDGSWTNHGEAGAYTGSGRPSGKKGKDRCD